MFNRILVPLDGSKQSEEVLPLVQILAKGDDVVIVLLRVAEYPYALYSTCYEYPPSDPSLAKTIQIKKKFIRREVQDYLERIASTFDSSEVTIVTEVRDGSVIEAILSSADRHQIDLIVLSTCGQSGCTQPVIGAIADRVLHEAAVPVILIRNWRVERVGGLEQMAEGLLSYHVG